MVKNADKILMMEKGEIIENGSHKWLIQLKEKYADLFIMQAKRYLGGGKGNSLITYQALQLLK